SYTTEFELPNALPPIALGGVIGPAVLFDPEPSVAVIEVAVPTAPTLARRKVSHEPATNSSRRIPPNAMVSRFNACAAVGRFCLASSCAIELWSLSGCVAAGGGKNKL